MAEPTRINNHYEQMVDNFPTQFQDKPNIDAFLQVWSEQVQAIEDCFWSMYDETKLLNAGGVNLDRYGFLVGLTRPPGMSDDEYFSLVAGEIVARASDATVNSIRRITEAVTELRNTNIIEINNTINWRNSGYPKLTGDVMVFGYYSRRDRVISPFAGDLLLKACPVTTERAIYGQHIQFSEDINSLYIPCEVIFTPDPIGVESPLGNPLDELVTDAVGTDSIAVSANNFEAFGDNYELAILPEDSSEGGALSVNAGDGFETFQITNDDGSVETFTVQTAGIQANHGVMLEISVSN